MSNNVYAQVKFISLSSAMFMETGESRPSHIRICQGGIRYCVVDLLKNRIAKDCIWMKRATAHGHLDCRITFGTVGLNITPHSTQTSGCRQVIQNTYHRLELLDTGFNCCKNSFNQLTNRNFTHTENFILSKSFKHKQFV